MCYWVLMKLLATKCVSLNYVAKDIAHVVKYVNFQLYRVHPDGVIWKTDKWRQIYKQMNFTFYTSNDGPLKRVEKKNFSTSISRTKENLYLFVLILWLICFRVIIYIQYFFDVVGNKLQTKNIYCGYWKENQSSRTEYVS